jgi:hypothetical protein
VRAAGMLLKGLGVLMPEDAGSEDPGDIAKRRNLAERAHRVELDELEQELKQSEALSADVPKWSSSGDLGIDLEDIISGDVDHDDPEVDTRPARAPTQAEIHAAAEAMLAERARAAERKAAQEPRDRENMGFHERRAAGDPNFQDHPAQGGKS